MPAGTVVATSAGATISLCDRRAECTSDVYVLQVLENAQADGVPLVGGQGVEQLAAARSEASLDTVGAGMVGEDVIRRFIARAPARCYQPTGFEHVR